MHARDAVEVASMLMLVRLQARGVACLRMRATTRNARHATHACARAPPHARTQALARGLGRSRHVFEHSAGASWPGPRPHVGSGSGAGGGGGEWGAGHASASVGAGARASARPVGEPQEGGGHEEGGGRPRSPGPGAGGLRHAGPSAPNLRLPHNSPASAPPPGPAHSSDTAALGRSAPAAGASARGGGGSTDARPLARLPGSPLLGALQEGGLEGGAEGWAGSAVGQGRARRSSWMEGQGHAAGTFARASSSPFLQPAGGAGAAAAGRARRRSAVVGEPPLQAQLPRPSALLSSLLRSRRGSMDALTGGQQRSQQQGPASNLRHSPATPLRGPLDAGALDPAGASAHSSGGGGRPAADELSSSGLYGGREGEDGTG